MASGAGISDAEGREGRLGRELGPSVLTRWASAAASFGLMVFPAPPLVGRMFSLRFWALSAAGMVVGVDAPVEGAVSFVAAEGSVRFNFGWDPSSVVGRAGDQRVSQRIG
jgi:hypothetical protein